MNLNNNLISIGKYDLRFNHLLIIGILTLSFSISFLIRILPGIHGWELNEFDPFFNFRATEFLVNNGIESYFLWIDDLSWYPNGRNVSETSQVMLHIFTGFSYKLFGINYELYEYVIIFPVIIGSLTTIVIFALARTIFGTTIGLISSLLFSISLPIMIRGQLGWFKSEPLGIFLGLLSVYLFISAIKNPNSKTVYFRILTGGVLLSLGFSSWGGNQFFIIPIGIFLLALPFFRNDHNFLLKTIPLFTASSIITTLFFERQGVDFIFGLPGLSLIISTIIMISIIFLMKISNQKKKIKNGLIFLISIIFFAILLLFFNDQINLIDLPSHRYLNALNPYLTTSDPLTDSISEHATTNISQSFLFHSILMIFSGLGIWFLVSNFKQKILPNELVIFILIFTIVGVYVSSVFMRLELFASLSLILISSFAIGILIKNSKNYKLKSIQILSFILLIGFIMTPLFLPQSSNVYTILDAPPTILNGATTYQISSSEWKDSLNWIKNNTPEDAIIASWWDYGYWIQTLSNRTTVSDNSTLIDHRIKKIAEAMFLPPSESVNKFSELQADYLVLFISGERLPFDSTNDEELFLLTGGGDESKLYWIGLIGNTSIEKYLIDGFVPTNLFWEETTMGQLIPFERFGFANFREDKFSYEYEPGLTPIYKKKIVSVDEFELIYSSSSYHSQPGEIMMGIFIYKINN